MAPFFVCLGVADALFLLSGLASKALSLTSNSTQESRDALSLFTLFFQTLSICTTLTVGVIRWLSVTRPLRMRLMSRRHVVVTCAGLISWSIVVTALCIIHEYVVLFGSAEYMVLVAVRVIVGYALPILLLLGFSMALLVAFHHQGLKAARHQRRATVAVLLIAGSSLLTYPVGILVYYLMYLENRGHISLTVCDSLTCRMTFRAVSHLLQAFNASVNFPIYVFLASSFREELCQKFQCIWNALARPFTLTDPAKDMSADVDLQASAAQDLSLEVVRGGGESFGVV